MSDVNVYTNFPQKSKQISRYAKKLNKNLLRDAIAAAMQEIANKSAVDYFRLTRSVDQARNMAPVSDRITSRTNRLIASVLGAFNFNTTGLPSKTKSDLSMPTKITGGEAGVGRRESIREIRVTPNGFTGLIGSKTPYAAIHEFGGNTGRATIPSRPYLRPAIKASQEQTIAIFRSTIEESWKEADV